MYHQHALSQSGKGRDDRRQRRIKVAQARVVAQCGGRNLRQIRPPKQTQLSHLGRITVGSGLRMRMVKSKETGPQPR
jgi:hypothetical protein